MVKDGFYNNLHVQNLKVDSINLLSNAIDFTVKGSGERIKSLYENLQNTNCFTDFYKNLLDVLTKNFTNGFLKIYLLHKAPQVPVHCFTFVTDDFDNLLICRNSDHGMKYYKLDEYLPSTCTTLNIQDDENIRVSIQQNG